jgi:hypothetical protein
MDTLAVANLLLDVASIINFIALLWMLRAIIKNRNYLRGFSIVGSFLTFISIVGFELARSVGLPLRFGLLLLFIV